MGTARQPAHRFSHGRSKRQRTGRTEQLLEYIRAQMADLETYFKLGKTGDRRPSEPGQAPAPDASRYRDDTADEIQARLRRRHTLLKDLASKEGYDTTRLDSLKRLREIWSDAVKRREEAESEE